MVNICYKDTVVFVVVTTNEYGSKKSVIEQHDVKGDFMQNTGFTHSNNQDVVNADAILYVDPKNAFIIANHNRLEGLYVIAALFGADPTASWYKVTHVSVNRDHLLGTKIDNIEVALKKTDSLPGVS